MWNACLGNVLFAREGPGQSCCAFGKSRAQSTGSKCFAQLLFSPVQHHPMPVLQTVQQTSPAQCCASAVKSLMYCTQGPTHNGLRSTAHLVSFWEASLSCWQCDPWKQCFILHLGPLGDGEDLLPADNEDRWTCILGNGMEAMSLRDERLWGHLGVPTGIIKWRWIRFTLPPHSVVFLCKSWTSPWCSVFQTLGHLQDALRGGLKGRQRNFSRFLFSSSILEGSWKEKTFPEKLLFLTSQLNVIERFCLLSPGDWHLLWIEGNSLFILT